MDSFAEGVLALPWQTQVILATGYAAYSLAYIGIRSQHRTIDIIFRTLLFGAVAAIFLYSPADVPDYLRVIVATIVTLGLAVVWRAVGRDVVRRRLKDLNFSHADDEQSPLERFAADREHVVTQVTAILDDGRELMCDDASRFRDAPLGPIILGQDGSVAFYVTTSRRWTDGAPVDAERPSVADEGWGAEWTYVPAGSITELRFRLLKKG
jgi:hypothetical protein